MIVVSGFLSFDPANTEAFHEALGALVPTTRAEDGCVSYGFYADPAEPGTYRIFEEWASQEAMDAHMGTAHLAEFMGAMGDFGVTATELYAYAVSDKSRLM
jgi:quinol monooxygenase YgiN